MLKASLRPWRVGAVLGTAVLLASSGAAQTLVGNARAVRATTLGLLGGTTTVLADTGALAGAGDAKGASRVVGSVPALVSAEVLDAVTIGWPDQAASQASLANLGVSAGGLGITADLVMATITAVPGGTSASSLIQNLSINGAPVAVTGEPNQLIFIPGGRVVLNEQKTSSSGTTVNALHAVVTGVADIVVASATAGIQ